MQWVRELLQLPRLLRQLLQLLPLPRVAPLQVLLRGAVP